MRTHLFPLAVMLAGFALSAAPAQAACDKPVSPGELARMLSTADAAFGNMDAVSFRSALSLVRSSIPCLSGPLAESQAAAYHRAEAYDAFLNRDHAAVVQQFRALLSASPGYRLSDQVAPDGHPLRTDFEIAQGLPTEPSRPLPPPVAGSLRVDGRASTQAPVALPFLVQQVDDEGNVLTSALVEQGSTLTPYPALQQPVPTLRSGGKRRVGVPLVAAALVAGVASAGLYGFSSARASDFWDPATPDDELQQLRRQTNATGYASLGAGIVAIGAGTAAVLTFVW
ncbi:MAG: hypothetical protein GXP62_11865 [Oligoflexia bacterium]|nr:hypothetical protein [Oligoflexia bacterium]